MVATLALMAVGVSFVYGWVGPSSFFGSLLVKLGFGLGGSEILSYLVGVIMVGVGIFAVGLLVELGLRRWLRHASDTVLGRIPVVKTVYETVGNFVAMLSKEGPSSARGMTPVWCRFGDTPGTLVLGLLSSPDPVWIEGVKFRVVIVPTAPVPVGGGLLFIPEERVVPAPGLGVDALTSIYVSMGVTAPQFLPPPKKAIEG
jgi:uncharacterized membrane protein